MTNGDVGATQTQKLRREQDDNHEAKQQHHSMQQGQRRKSGAHASRAVPFRGENVAPPSVHVNGHIRFVLASKFLRESKVC